MNALEPAAARMIAPDPDGPNDFGRPAGVAIGMRRGSDTWTATAGSRTAGADAAPMTAGTSHDLASITKILATTTSLIRLVSCGELGLDDPVADFLPGFSGGGKEGVTVRMLLQHRGGLWEWQPLYLATGGKAEALRYIERLPLRYSPDSGRHYSDLGFMLLGRIIETVTGLDLHTAVRQLVISPMGLADTRYAYPASTEVAASAFGDAAERAMVDTGSPYPVLAADQPFNGWRDGQIRGLVNDGNAFHVFGGVSGHAGLFATLGDLLAFATFLADYRDHEELWKPKVVEQFLAAGPDAGQSLGFRRYDFESGGATTVMYGHPGFVGCVVGFAPAAGVALALCSNRLLSQGPPVPTDELWSQTREAAAVELTGHFRESQR